MKKSINGKIIDIDNIEIFEKAYEGMAINRCAYSRVPGIEYISNENIQSIIKLYLVIYKSIPFPLYAIDSDIKYAAIGEVIKQSGFEDISMWVKDGLYVNLKDTEKALYFINNSWGIVHIDYVEEDNISINNFSNHTGYNEMLWVMEKIKRGESTFSYYDEFMPKFAEACNRQPAILKREFRGILEFCNVPKRINLRPNEVIEFDTNDKYIIDIFVSGQRKVEKEQLVFSFLDDSDDNDGIRKEISYVNKYGLGVYRKPFWKEGVKDDRLVKDEMLGAISIYNTLNAIKSFNESSKFEDYKGFIADRRLVYQVGDRVFVAKAYKYIEPTEIARGLDIYSYASGIVYLVKTYNLGNGAKKEKIYSYALCNGDINLCKIQFINE